VVGAVVVICLERGADLHTAQLMLLPLTVSCINKMQIGFTFMVLAYPGSTGKGPLNVRVCVCACVRACVCVWVCIVVGDRSYSKQRLVHQECLVS